MIVWAKGPRFSPMTHRLPNFITAIRRPGPVGTLLAGLSAALLVALAVVGPAKLWAQIEGDRGIQPVATTHDIEVDGITVDIQARSGEEARQQGWHEAARKAWEKLGGPRLSDSQIEDLVSAVVIGHEQIGPRRYIATLGVIFDRGRAGQYLGSGAQQQAQSPPLLVLPVVFQGGVGQVFEVRGVWQKAWAEFQPGASPIDYVRPTGAGADSLMLTAGQARRRSRAWWINLLNQFGADDVLVPEARLERQWPGGPVHGTFVARYGPDDTTLASFAMTAPDAAHLDEMLAQAVRRMDAIYVQALADGKLKPDPTLGAESPHINPALAAFIAAQNKDDAVEADITAEGDPIAQAIGSATITVQFASPDAAAIDAALAAARGAPGVVSANTSSLAIGGVSVMRVSTNGDAAGLAAALRGRGYTVTGAGSTLSIRK